MAATLVDLARSVAVAHEGLATTGLPPLVTSSAWAGAATERTPGVSQTLTGEGDWTLVADQQATAAPATAVAVADSTEYAVAPDPAERPPTLTLDAETVESEPRPRRIPLAALTDPAWQLSDWDRRIRSWERLLDAAVALRPPRWSRAAADADQAPAEPARARESAPGKSSLFARSTPPIQGAGAPVAGESVTAPRNSPPSGSSSLAAAEAVRRRFPWLGWLLLWSGMMGFVCGLVLVAWSFLGGRADLWDLGVPLTLIGQIGLLLGVILQLDRLWQDRPSASDAEQMPEPTVEPSVAAHRARRAWYADTPETPPPPFVFEELADRIDDLSRRLGELAS